jgi:hypothetical protein
LVPEPQQTLFLFRNGNEDEFFELPRFLNLNLFLFKNKKRGKIFFVLLFMVAFLASAEPILWLL